MHLLRSDKDRRRRAIIIFPKKTIIGRTVKTSASQLFQRQWHRPSIRGKKWHWPLFTNALNVTVVAAWRIHCKIAGSPKSHLDFRREIAICVLKMSMVSRLQVGDGPRVNLPDDVRFDGEDHKNVVASQGRCKGLQKNGRYMCAKCCVWLHLARRSKCHVTYHMRSGQSQ